MFCEDLNMCDREGRAINPTAISSVSLILKWSIKHSLHANDCRLAGMQTVLIQGPVISSVCDTVRQMTPEEQEYLRM